MSAPNTFGVTAITVHDEYFGHTSEWSAASVPTDTKVTEIISKRATRLDAALRARDIDPAQVAADATSSAYLWCADVIGLDSAIRVVHAGQSQDPEVVKAWRTEVEARYLELARRGSEVLGSGVTAPAVEPIGPNDHIDDDGLETENTDDISPVLHKLRVTDKL